MTLLEFAAGLEALAGEGWHLVKVKGLTHHQNQASNLASGSPTGSVPILTG